MIHVYRVLFLHKKAALQYVPELKSRLGGKTLFRVQPHHSSTRRSAASNGHNGKCINQMNAFHIIIIRMVPFPCCGCTGAGIILQTSTLAFNGFVKFVVRIEWDMIHGRTHGKANRDTRRNAQLEMLCKSHSTFRNRLIGKPFNMSSGTPIHPIGPCGRGKYV
eukprot:scaffold28709_cov43-Attheya_sp.AAC.3